ncbi:MAG: ROK family protein [Vicinamibacterales bacterium]
MPYGGVEAGGTKVVCVIGTGPDDIRAETRVPTTTPASTLAQVQRFFRGGQQTHGPLAALGIGCFGPIDLHPASPTCGFITSTPKPGWAHTDVAGVLRRELGLPVAFDTDVNAAAVGEWRWGAAQGLANVLYVTVGTGIGGGALVDGRPLHGLVHPEMGHVRVPHDRDADPFAGGCPFHGDCLEGLASGPAMAARWGAAPESLPADHPAWALEARYLALALHGYVCTLSPERIVVGGGVGSAPGLLPRVRRELAALLNGYVQAPALDDLDTYVVAPGLGARAGVLGALALAERLVAAG